MPRARFVRLASSGISLDSALCSNSATSIGRKSAKNQCTPNFTKRCRKLPVIDHPKTKAANKTANVTLLPRTARIKLVTVKITRRHFHVYQVACKLSVAGYFPNA